MDVQSTEPQPTARVTPPFSGTLDDLLLLDAPALERLYAGARVPKVESLRRSARPHAGGAGVLPAGADGNGARLRLPRPLPLARQVVLRPHRRPRRRGSTASSPTPSAATSSRPSSARRAPAPSTPCSSTIASPATPSSSVPSKTRCVSCVPACGWVRRGCSCAARRTWCCTSA